MTPWEVFAVKYADRNARTRMDSFLFDDDHHLPHDMDYFIWVLRRDNDVILVDTGYDQEEGDRRGRPIRLHPVEALSPLGIDPLAVSTIIVTASALRSRRWPETFSQRNHSPAGRRNGLCNRSVHVSRNAESPLHCRPPSARRCKGSIPGASSFMRVTEKSGRVSPFITRVATARAFKRCAF